MVYPIIPKGTHDFIFSHAKAFSFRVFLVLQLKYLLKGTQLNISYKDINLDSEETNCWNSARSLIYAIQGQSRKAKSKHISCGFFFPLDIFSLVA